MKQNSILITGYAKTPEGITANEIYNIIVVAMQVDRKTGFIEDVEVSLATDLAKKFVKNILVGEKITEIDHIEQKFNEHFFGMARKAIVSSIRTCYDKFVQINQ